MPRRYRRRRRRFRRRKKSTRGVAYHALRVAKKISNQIETKFFDTLVREFNVDDAGIGPINLCNPGQGFTDTNRIGDRIQLTSIRWRQMCIRDNNENLGVRVIIILDKYNTVDTINDILTLTGAPDVGLYSDYNHDKRRDYRVLYDRVHSIDQNNRTYSFKFTRMKLKYTVKFQDATTIIEKGALKLYLISNQPGEADAPQYQANFRVFYKDG